MERWIIKTYRYHSPQEVDGHRDERKGPKILDSWAVAPVESRYVKATDIADLIRPDLNDDIQHELEACQGPTPTSTFEYCYLLRLPGGEWSGYYWSLLDHVVACRHENMVSRQTSLPLFLAACEQRVRAVQQKIMQFCSVWNDRTQYQMFGCTTPLLGEVWAKQGAKSFENVW